MSEPPPRRWQWALAGLAAAWFAGFACFPELFSSVCVAHYGVWFLDSFAILASNDAVARGLDPHAPNPLDYFQRPHVYSHWWLGLRGLGLTRADNFRVGVALCAGFFLAAVARLRPRTPAEGLWYLAILGSAPVLLALNRANNDLAIFILLAPVVPCLLDERRMVRHFAVVLIALAAGLKFFPAAAGLVLLAEAGSGGRETRARVTLGALALALVCVDLAPDLSGLGRVVPRATGLMTFAAAHLPGFLGLGERAAAGVGLGAGVAATGIFWRWQPLGDWAPEPEDRGAWWSFILGAVLLAGCFFTGTNYGYRWIFAVWLAPFLWCMARDAAAPAAVRRLAGGTAGLLIFSLWADAALSAAFARLTPRLAEGEAQRIGRIFFAAEQPVAWIFFLCLLVFLAHFARAGIRALVRAGPVTSVP